MYMRIIILARGPLRMHIPNIVLKKSFLEYNRIMVDGTSKVYPETPKLYPGTPIR